MSTRDDEVLSCTTTLSQVLALADFKVVETIGVAFYKNDNDHSSLETPFLPLENLSFHNMPSWENLMLFLNLRGLQIGGLPNHLPALETLAPAIRELWISKSNKGRGVHVSCHHHQPTNLSLIFKHLKLFQHHQPHELLESLSIYNIYDSLTSFPLKAFPNLKHLVSCLHYLDICCCPNFVSFPIEGMVGPSITVFGVLTFNKLKLLPCHMYTLLPNLQHPEIIDCSMT
ncbi:hypothetical protein CR513_47226, partial [Mucuna pruriens]